MAETVKQLRAKLKRLEKPRTLHKTVGEAARDAIKPLQPIEKAELTAAFKTPTGALVRSVKVRSMKRSRTRTGARLSIQIPYAGPVILGHKAPSGKQVEQIPVPQKVANENRARIIADFGRRLGPRLERLAKHG